jgi:uncharacterized protein (TIGR02246 family)
MRNTLLSLGLIIAVLVVIAQYVQSHPERPGDGAPADKPAQKEGKPAADRSADEAAIRANVERFVKAYNDGDAKVVASLFTPDGQAIDKDGDESHGREEIAQTFADLFKERPKRRLEVSIESIRFLGPDLAEEVGTTKETSAPDEPPERDRYTALHVKRDGKWQMALVREEEGELPTPHERLQPLAWLVGEWVDDGGSAVVASTCRWSADGNFLLQDFKLRINGREAMDVTQRIGWDPHAKHIHSWVFDSEGGYGEGDWVPDGNGWLIRATGVRPDGTTASATNFLVPVGHDGYFWRSADRILAEERQPPMEVKVVRKPPEAKQ